MSFSRGIVRLASLRSSSIVLSTSRNVAIRANSAAAAAVHDLSNLRFALEQKLEAKSVLGIHISYPALVAALKHTGTPSSSDFKPLSRPQLLTLLEILAASGRPQDLQRIEEILGDLSPVFGIDLSHDIHTVIIRGLISYGNVQTIHRWLLRMPLHPGHLSPTPEQFHMFLEACLNLATFKYMRHVVKTMRQTGCKPTNETFKYLIRSRWLAASQYDKIPHVSAFSHILDDMKLENLPYDDSVAALLRESFLERDLHSAADQVQALYDSRFLVTQSPADLQNTEWTAKLAGVAQAEGLKAAMKLLKFSTSDVDVSPAALRAILRQSRTVDDLHKVQEEFNIVLDVSHWSILINNNTRTGNLSAALRIYEETKTTGIKPDAALIGPLIRSLCRSVGKPPTDDSLEKALEIYHDLARAVPPSSGPTVSKESYNDHASGPDIGIYNDLLRGLASSPNTERHHAAAKSLLEDMAERSISTNDSAIASSFIVLHMRRSPTVEDALDIYYQLRSSLDEKGYAVVLNAFCSLSFGDILEAPSLSGYFEIVKDMRRAGLEITVEVYTILLRQIATIATKSKDPNVRAHSNLRNALVTTTRRTHDFLTLDAAVSPDAHVWNQLMDTYQRLGCFGDAYRVWETMYLSGRFDHVSVSIILDACGFAGAWQVAQKICQSLFNDRFAFNLHNWNTWIECLCRVGRLNDAVKVVCLEMGKHENPVNPDVESAKIVIKFARRDGLYDEVKQRLEQYIPELWEILPSDLKQS